MYLFLVLAVVIVAGDQITALLKSFFGHARPCAELRNVVQVPVTEFTEGCIKPMQGMPSGHAWNAFTVAVFAGMTLRSWRWFGVLVVIAIAVAFSRVYLGLHYPSQVLVGALLGSLYGVTTAYVWLRLPVFAKFKPHEYRGKRSR
jgi:undecaprenyl-diphosphatase